MQDNANTLPSDEVGDSPSRQAVESLEQSEKALRRLGRNAAVEHDEVQERLARLNVFRRRKRPAAHEWTDGQLQIVNRILHDISILVQAHPEPQIFGDFTFSPERTLGQDYYHHEAIRRAGSRVLALIIEHLIQERKRDTTDLASAIDAVAWQLNCTTQQITNIHGIGQFYTKLLETQVPCGALWLLGSHHSQFGRLLWGKAARFANRCFEAVPNFAAQSAKHSPSVIRAILHTAKCRHVPISKDSQLYSIIQTECEKSPGLAEQAGWPPSRSEYAFANDRLGLLSVRGDSVSHDLENARTLPDRASNAYCDSSHATGGQSRSTPIDVAEGSQLPHTTLSIAFLSGTPDGSTTELLHGTHVHRVPSPLQSSSESVQTDTATGINLAEHMERARREDPIILEAIIRWMGGKHIPATLFTALASVISQATDVVQTLGDFLSSADRIGVAIERLHHDSRLETHVSHDGYQAYSLCTTNPCEGVLEGQSVVGLFHLLCLAFATLDERRDRVSLQLLQSVIEHFLARLREAPWDLTDYVVDALLVSCKKGDLDCRLWLARQAHNLTEAGWSVRRGNAVLEMSKIYRLKGEYKESMHHLRLFRAERRPSDPVGKFLEPRMFIQELENLIQTDQLAAALAIMENEDTSMQSPREGGMDLDFQVKKTFVFAKIYRAMGDFVNCVATLRSIVQRPNTADNIVHRCWLADAHTDLGQYDEAFAVLTIGLAGQLDSKAMCGKRSGRRIVTSLADVYLAAGDVAAAQERLGVLTDAHAQMSKYSVSDQLLDVRTLISHARCSHESDAPTAMRRWRKVQRAVERHPSFCAKGTPYGISALASCDVCLRAGDFTQALQHFHDAKLSLSTRSSYYWFPTLSPWTERLAAKIASLTGWTLGDSDVP